MTDKNLDKLFSEKLSGSHHAYREGAWENAMASWEKQAESSQSVDALFKEQLINARAPYDNTAWLRFEHYQKGVVQKALFKKIALGLTAGIATLAAVFWLNSSNPIISGEIEKTNPNNKSQLETANKNDEEKNSLKTNSLSSIEKTAPNSNISRKNKEAPAIRPPDIENTSIATSGSEASNFSALSNASPENKELSGNAHGTNFNSSTNEATKTFDLGSIVPLFMRSKSIKPLKVNHLKSLPLRGNSKSKKPKKWYAELHGGLTLASPIVNNQGTNSRQSLSYLAGIGLNRELSNKFTLESGLIYYNRSAENTDITIEDVGFSFGKEASITTVNPEQLHYIGVPIVANYNVFSRHYLGLGVQLGYLLAVKTESTEVLYENNIIQSETTVKGWGYNEAFANVDAALMVNYHYLITDRLKLGASYNFGLVDVTNNAISGNQYFDRNSQFMLRLRYRVINF